jgi:hypothetical protein
MSAKIIDLEEYKQEKTRKKFNNSRDKLIEDLDRSGIFFDKVTPLPEQIDKHIQEVKEELAKILEDSRPANEQYVEPEFVSFDDMMKRLGLTKCEK